ncbi:UDP-glucose/GDP-mannose dehydrogenase family protein [Romboutsia maritimum]|uniref:UDP-glucose 6-dehydrogenase n=1 Tax=Romboutsia maritimum TaxID=2020948 RepID=A0A371IRR6_9FIRM|nr:UDP-glucose/GDP-mannose dehydrogenase family protein [Romboutsia maritimum]RDY23165.1 UDP-glucose/GDP-mannose dehydrogenase family protein [Romboutsia maritimum]
MNIAIAGTGYVGLVTGICLAQLNCAVVTCVDIDETKVAQMKLGKPPIYEDGLEELMKKNYELGKIDYTTDYKSAYKNADVIIIAVGTPERSDGSANLDYIKAVINQIAKNIEKDCLVVTKSTVPIGTNDKIESYIKENLVNKVRVEVASNPEFLSQGSAIKDTLNASRIIIGTESKWAEDILKLVYKPFNQPIISTNRKSAEMIKYASNNFLALKIAYMNDIANFCELVGANIEDVAIGMSYDERIGDKFLKAGIGYGGSCFPKDTRALHCLASEFCYELKTVKAAIEVNEYQKLKLIRKASEKIEQFENMKVAILGLTFKPGTDDMRHAPSISNINSLIERGANIFAYDPVGIENAKKIFEDKINYTMSIDEAISEAEVCFIMTEWEDIVNYDIKKYKKLMKKPIIYDGRNCYEVSKMKNLDIEYYSIGR